MSLFLMRLNLSASHICTVKVPLQSSEVREENPERLRKIGSIWTGSCACGPSKRPLVLQETTTNANMLIAREASSGWTPPQRVCSPSPCFRRSSVSLCLTLLTAPQQSKGATFEVGQAAAGNESFMLSGSSR